MNFHSLYSLSFKNKKVDMWYNRLFVRLINLTLPIFYYVSSLFLDRKREGGSDLNSREKYIVSLTSFPARINTLWLVIESLLRQKEKADAIILWLYKGEFNGKSSLPKSLLRLEKWIQIRFCDENLMPHKKYFYTMQQYPEANVITVDDDVIYSPDLIKNLKYFHGQFPEAICASIVQKITFDHTGLKPYSQWPHIKENTAPSFRYLPIGAGGVLYPPKSLHPEIMDRPTLKRLALTADDLWLKLMSVRQGTKVVGLAGGDNKPCIPVYIKNNQNLMQRNVVEGQNNQVIRNLLNYYDLSPAIFEDKIDTLQQKLS